MVRISAAGYAALPDVRDGTNVDDGVWVSGEREGLSVHPQVFAIPECEGGNEVSGDLLFYRRWRYASRSDECKEDDAVDAALDFKRKTDSVALQFEGRA